MSLTDTKRQPIEDHFEIGPLEEWYFVTKRLIRNWHAMFSGWHNGVSKDNHEKVSIRYVDKEKLDDGQWTKEVEILRALTHPGISRLKDIYEDKKYYIVVQEAALGGELFTKLKNKLTFSEKQASKLIHQIVSVLDYLHSQNIVHGNIRAESLYYEDKKCKKIKLWHFEKAHYVSEKKILGENNTKDTRYLAPELMDGKPYTLAVDIYSVGIILYKMLSGDIPFEKDRRSKHSELLFSNKEWNDITSSVKELLCAMLHKDPTKRPTTKKILEDPWVRRIVPQLEVNDAKSDSDSVISRPPDPKPKTLTKHYPKPTPPATGTGISGWTFSDILGLGASRNSEFDSTDELFSPTASEDLNTKSSASTLTSPRTPKRSADTPSVGPTPEKGFPLEGGEKKYKGGDRRKEARNKNGRKIEISPEKKKKLKHLYAPQGQK